METDLGVHNLLIVIIGCQNNVSFTRLLSRKSACIKSSLDMQNSAPSDGTGSLRRMGFPLRLGGIRSLPGQNRIIDSITYIQHGVGRAASESDDRKICQGFWGNNSSRVRRSVGSKNSWMLFEMHRNRMPYDPAVIYYKMSNRSIAFIDVWINNTLV